MKYLRNPQKRLFHKLAPLTAIVLTSTLAGCGLGSNGQTKASDSGPINVGFVQDQTGPTSGYGIPMIQATKLAIQDINDNGGVLGRKLKLDFQDGQSDVSRYVTVARKFIAHDPRLAVVMGGLTSSSREAVRPLFGAAKIPYWHSNLYEGGVCDKNFFNVGPTASQAIAPMMKWAADNGKKNIYIVAADYNFGWNSASFTKKYAAENKLNIITKPAFFPLSQSDFSAELPKIRASGADTIVSFLVGSAQTNFYKQWAAAGMNRDTTILSSDFNWGDEQLSLGTAAKGVMSAFPYFPDLDTPASQKFVADWKAAGYGARPAPGAETAWTAWHLWANAVEKAGSTDRDKVTAAIEGGGISYEGPAGKVTMDAATHHAILPMRLIEATGQGTDAQVALLAPAKKPLYEASVCDLVNEPTTNKQFQP